MTDLSTRYLGLKLNTPLVVSASPLSQEISGIRRLEDAGASAIVLYSLFEEQLRQEARELEYHLSAGTESFAESLTYLPMRGEFRTGPEGYLEHIRKAKEAVAVPVIASLNGATLGGWTKYAREIEEAGADAIECNIYSIPSDINVPGVEIEQQYIDISARGEGRGAHSGRREAGPIFQQHGQHGQKTRTGWSRRARSVQPLLPAGY
jgi:dihydroorotate dehydrogenase (fumarate)